MSHTTHQMCMLANFILQEKISLSRISIKVYLKNHGKDKVITTIHHGHAYIFKKTSVAFIMKYYLIFNIIMKGTS